MKPGFISVTINDLREERHLLTGLLLQHGYYPLVREAFEGQPNSVGTIERDCGAKWIKSGRRRMTPEAKARQQIDPKLEQAGWVIQDMAQLNLGVGVAVREYPTDTDTGPADYVLFVNRKAVGVIEAKKDAAGENITVTESQTDRYANATLKWRKYNTPLPFLFEATGQISAVSRLEKSLAINKPRALAHMATGAGKTFTAITSVYRLLKFGGAKRILFLVDTRNLSKQAHQDSWPTRRRTMTTSSPSYTTCSVLLQRIHAERAENIQSKPRRQRPQAKQKV